MGLGGLKKSFVTIQILKLIRITSVLFTKVLTFLKIQSQCIRMTQCFYFICRKSERQIVPTKSQIQGHYLRNSSTTLPYTHFRRDIPDRACMRQEEYYVDSDDYMSPAPAPPHTRVDRVPESSQWAQEGNEYSTPPDSDRYVFGYQNSNLKYFQLSCNRIPAFFYELLVLSECTKM